MQLFPSSFGWLSCLCFVKITNYDQFLRYVKVSRLLQFDHQFIEIVSPFNICFGDIIINHFTTSSWHQGKGICIFSCIVNLDLN